MEFHHSRLGGITRDKLHRELGQILLVEADQITITAGLPVAEAFIGFRLEDNPDHLGEFMQEPASRVHLHRFEIFRDFEKAYEFVKHLSPSDDMRDVVFRLKSFCFHAPRSGKHSAICDSPLPFMTPEGVCRLIADAAYARYKLELIGSEVFSIREIALLADVPDDVVRACTQRVDADRLQATKYAKSTEIGADDARLWLTGQAGFTSSYGVQNVLDSVKTAEELGTSIRNRRFRSEGGTEKLVVGFTADELDKWEGGDIIWDPRRTDDLVDRAADLARHLDLDVPLFVGKVIGASTERCPATR